MSIVLKLLNIPLFVSCIFSGDPKPPCTFIVHFNNIPKSERNKILWQILVTGAKKIYGNQISIDTIEPYQFFLLDRYLQSMGFKIKYDNINCPQGILIWFDEIKISTLCNGFTIIKN